MRLKTDLQRHEFTVPPAVSANCTAEKSLQFIILWE
jgi:hypothetical protein